MDDEVSEEGSLLPHDRKESHATRSDYRRLITGGIFLVLVDLLWVGSAELSDFIFHNEGFDKPFFTTYFKTAAFVLYLPGVWIEVLCKKYQAFRKFSSNQAFQHNTLQADLPPTNIDVVNECHGQQSPRRQTAGTIDDDLKFPVLQRLPLLVVMKVALIFCILWFLATLSYQEALALTSPAAVNILSSSSGLFTLLLAAIFQSSQNDRFSYSKLVAVLMSISGIVLVTFSDSHQTKSGVNYGALFALTGAILYSVYLVLLKLKVPNENQMKIATFFGFVGLFNIVLLWPGFFLLHMTKIEVFELPQNWKVWVSLIVNAILGTVLSEYFWLWGCYLTSSLSATLALGMVMPLTMLTDILRGRIHLNVMFVCGSIPVFLSFFFITFLCHYQNWDPMKNVIVAVCRRCTT